VVSQAEAVVGGGALLIDCSIAAADPALKEVSNRVVVFGSPVTGLEKDRDQTGP